MAIWDFLTSQRQSVPGFSPLSADHKRRQELFGLYWDYYRGKHRRPLKLTGGADDNVIVNYSRRVVDKSAAFLFGKEVHFVPQQEGSGDNETYNEEAEQYLKKVWGSSEEKAMTLQEMAIDGGVTGTCFVRIYPPQIPGDLPRIAVLNPSLIEVVSDPDDMDCVVAYHIVWKSGDMWKRHRIDSQQDGLWVITEEVNKPGSDVWTIQAETVWAYSEPPIHWCQNRPNPIDIWGISDLEEADMNDTINFTASNINKILKFHAHPRTIGTGFNASQLQNTGADQFWTVPSPDAKVFNLEMQSDLVSAYNFWAGLREAYSKITGVPDLDPSKVNVGQMSGFALRILYSDLIELTDVKRNTYGEMLSGINATLLEMGGFGPGLNVENDWQDPLPVDQASMVQLLALDRQQGLSLESYLRARGYDVDEEMRRIQSEQAGRTTLGEELLRAFERGNPQQTTMPMQPAMQAAPNGAQ